MSFRRLRNVGGLFGTILKWFGVIFLFPMIFALWHGTSVVPYIVPLVLCVGVGFSLERRLPDIELEMADGFLLVVLTWVVTSVVGALPYMLTGIGSMAHPVNAIFESVSGFTCTGSTVMDEISLERYPHAMMIWRQLTQWIGGMGILVLAVAILPRLSVGGAQFLDNEVPGAQMDRLTPHMAETARRLWLLYIGASALLFAIFLAIHYTGLDPAMDPFQAIAHTFTTLPSGGFSPMGRSVEGFAPIVQWVMIPFMFIAAMNFVVLWRAIFNGPRTVMENTEFKVYTGLFIGIGVLVSLMLALHGEFPTVEANFRHGFFQVATFLTTTGYASTDFAVWPGDTIMVLILLMFICGSVGSTAGGLKVLRWVVGFKVIYREIIQQMYPSAVRPLRMGQRVLNEGVVRGVLVIIVVYFALFGVSALLVSINVHFAGLQIETLDLFSAVATTLANVGPGVGVVGPMESFLFFPAFTKLWMCFLMIAGRLEIITFLVLLAPGYWRD